MQHNYEERTEKTFKNGKIYYFPKYMTKYC